MRFDEILEGVRTDLAIKLFGPNYDQLVSLADQVSGLVGKIPDAGEIVVDRPGRTETTEFIPDATQTLRYMLTADQINNAISIGLAGRQVGRVDAGNIFYPIVVRTTERFRTNADNLNLLPVRSADSSLVIGLGDVGKWRTNRLAVSTISREQAERREAVLVTVNSPDVIGFVERAREAIQSQLKLPPGYRLEFSGSFENWQSGSRRLLVAGLVFVLLSLLLVYAALKNWKQTVLVALGIPLAMVGGVYGLWFGGLPLTMPAAIGFVTLGGLSILNGMLLITYFNYLRARGIQRMDAALTSAKTRLRPVLMTARWPAWVFCRWPFRPARELNYNGHLPPSSFLAS